MFLCLWVCISVLVFAWMHIDILYVQIYRNASLFLDSVYLTLCVDLEVCGYVSFTCVCVRHTYLLRYTCGCEKVYLYAGV